MEVRVLTETDVEEYHGVRLRSLQEHPEAFGASYEEEKEVSLEKVATQLKANPTFGAFVDGKLVGIVSLSRYTRRKLRHRAMIGGMYVCPEARGQGVGNTLLKTTLDFARELDGLKDVVLAVTVGNETARTLYLKTGFKPYSLDPRFIRVGDVYHDIEWMILSLHN